jgi:AcrR family transcriptional regulator
MARLPDHRAKIELLRAAEGEFAEHGLSAAKVEAITARAGVSKGAFYLHFVSKEDCFRTIVESFLARIAACIDTEAFADGVPDSPELLERALAHDIAIMEVCWQSRALMRMLLEGGGGTPHAYLVAEFRERMRAQSEEWLHRAVEPLPPRRRPADRVRADLGGVRAAHPGPHPVREEAGPRGLVPPADGSVHARPARASGRRGGHS